MRKTNGERTRKTGTDEELTELEVLLTDLLFKISVKRKTLAKEKDNGKQK